MFPILWCKLLCKCRFRAANGIFAYSDFVHFILFFNGKPTLLWSWWNSPVFSYSPPVHPPKNDKFSKLLYVSFVLLTVDFHSVFILAARYSVDYSLSPLKTFVILWLLEHNQRNEIENVENWEKKKHLVFMSKQKLGLTDK